MSDIDEMIDRLTPRQRDEFALACARRLVEKQLIISSSCIDALSTREKWLRGEATDQELESAARLAAWNAISAASWSAVWASVGWAQRAAMNAVAAVPMKDAERRWQRAELERMLKEGGGA